MQVFSDQPGFQFYTGNFLPPNGSLIGKNKTPYSTHGGLCVETQNFPDAINQVIELISFSKQFNYYIRNPNITG